MPRTVDITRETYNNLVTSEDSAQVEFNGFQTSLETLLTMRPTDENDAKAWDKQFHAVTHQLKIGKRNAKEKLEMYREARRRFVLRAIVKNDDLFAKCAAEVLNTIPAK